MSVFVTSFRQSFDNEKYFRELYIVISKTVRRIEFAVKTVSTRELEILQLISEGLSSKEIASRLFISEETIKSHRRHLFNKFSARNSPNLVQKAFLKGFLNNNTI
jgi:DNA-binding CsgD family transcriptional regulator